MILNLRPAYVATLNAIVEDMSERYTLEEQKEIVNIVTSVLGKFPDEEPADSAGVEGGAQANPS